MGERVGGVGGVSASGSISASVLMAGSVGETDAAGKAGHLQFRVLGTESGRRRCLLRPSRRRFAESISVG